MPRNSPEDAIVYQTSGASSTPEKFKGLDLIRVARIKYKVVEERLETLYNVEVPIRDLPFEYRLEQLFAEPSPLLRVDAETSPAIRGIANGILANKANLIDAATNWEIGPSLELLKAAMVFIAYFEVFNRLPDLGGYDNYLRAIETGNWSEEPAEQILRRVTVDLLSSDEYRDGAPYPSMDMPVLSALTLHEGHATMQLNRFNAVSNRVLSMVNPTVYSSKGNAGTLPKQLSQSFVYPGLDSVVNGGAFERITVSFENGEAKVVGVAVKIEVGGESAGISLWDARKLHEEHVFERNKEVADAK